MSKFDRKTPWYYCLSMNARSIVQSVVLNIGVERNVISSITFAMLF